MSDTRQRFLREIADRLDAASVVEVHVFPPLRQGGKETGVAVVAAERQREIGGEELASSNQTSAIHVDAAPESEPISANPESRTPNPDSPSRLTVYSAVYRHTLKGPERGKWELELVAEADAPLVTVDDVVRGVHRRAGEDIAPERLAGDAFRAALAEERWNTSAR